MCLAAAKGRCPAKAPAGYPLEKEMKQLFPPKSKSVRVKSDSANEPKEIKVHVRRKTEGTETKPKLVPRFNRQGAFNNIVGDSFKVFPSMGKLILIPRVHQKESTKPAPNVVPTKEPSFAFETAPLYTIGVPLTPRSKQRLPLQNPPPIPSPGMYMEQEVALPETIWLPTF